MSPDINHTTVLLAALANMVIGALWYSTLLFSKPWMKAMDKKPEDMVGNQKEATKGYLASFIAAILTGYVLAHFVSYAAQATDLRGITLGAQTGFWAWLGFVVTTALSTVVFEGRNKQLYLINMGYYLVAFVVMGMILTTRLA